MAGTTSHEVSPEVHGLNDVCDTVAETSAGVLGQHDVSALLARLVAERIPLALIADLANPGGPDSDAIMASEAQDVG